MASRFFFSLIALLAVSIGDFSQLKASEKKEMNCVVFADFQNPEDQGYLSSQKVRSMKECKELAEKWTESRCFRYGGFGYFQTIILDDTQSLKNDVVAGPTLKQCPKQNPPPGQVARAE
ncbi:MAG: hypothetical protein K2X47_18705 [Bdellovibrionales bacterium]|nr:hypothetical protein [Bdellovibrionales bacterium]